MAKVTKEKDPAFPQPGQRITRLANRLTCQHPAISMNAVRNPESSIPGDFRTWRVDVNVGWSSAPPIDLSTLFEGDEQIKKALAKKIHTRRHKKRREPRDVAFAMIKELQSQPWGWQLFGVRIMDRHKLGNNLSKLIHVEDLTVSDLPNLGTVMMFAGEPNAKKSWDLLAYAKNSIDPKNW